MKAIVLLSGGMDSALVLAKAVQRHGRAHVLALSFHYGQRHAFPELQRAGVIARIFGVALVNVGLDVPFWEASPLLEDDTPLTNAGAAVVPARNTLLVSYASACALHNGAREIWIGCCAADAEAFADCRPAWIAAMTTVLSLGVNGDLVLTAPLIDRTKAQIVREARDAGGETWSAVGQSWSCYSPDDDLRPCGECAACVARARGFAEAGEIDPGMVAA